jgi:maltose O-acetyltransferase
MGDVIIGDNCWLGTRVFLKEGIEIGENSVIGANSVVTKNIPSHAIAAGVPAKILRMKSDEAINFLFKSKLETQQLC